MELKSKFSEFKSFFFDCDGVLWQESELLPGAKQILDILHDSRNVCFLSNNSTKTLNQYIEKFHSFKLNIDPSNVISSVQATILYLNKFEDINNVYVIGEYGLISSLEEEGYIVSKNGDPKEIDAVIVGMDRKFDYHKLSIALKACLSGARFIATGEDPTFPTPEGIFPGAGSMVGALQAALVGKRPEMVCGKPNPLMATVMLERFNLKPHEVAFIGDRVSTDMQCALDAKISPILIKTGFGADEYSKYPDFPYYSVIESLFDLIE